MKEYSIIITANAETCLLDIAEYIALDNPARAFSFLDELTSSLKKTLSMFPFSGRVDEKIAAQEVSSFSYNNYTSYYRVSVAKGAVEILYVFNGKQKVDGFLESVSSN